VKFNVPAFKIGSGECNNYPLVEYVSKFKKTVILSTGMNSIKSISKSVDILKKNQTSFCLLHCTNLYPTPAKFVKLGAIQEMEKKFNGILVGLSDHTENIYSSLAAIALGAPIIEKHFTFSKKAAGPDISSSMDPQELKNLILGSKEIFLARGGTKKPLKQEIVTMNFAFASVVATKNILKGEKINTNNIWVKRPSGGDFSPSDYYKLIGKKAKRNISKDEQLRKKDL
jgi:N-acetylneuraminate synthase